MYRYCAATSNEGAFDFTVTTSSGELLQELTCPCAIRINVQTGNLFHGTATLQDPCGGAVPLGAARVEEDGRVEFSILTQVVQGQGCLKSSGPLFSGTFSNGTISASTMEVYDCSSGDLPDLTVDIALNATRI